MTTFDRSTNLRRLGEESFDIVVVGAGITGAGCALDAALRGLKVALIDRGDFASGTSSKSSKMVHGGLRYLQQGEIGLVYEALAERQRLLRNAAHLVKIVPHLIPLFGSGGVIPKKLSRAFGSALWTYDLTGGARIGKLHERIDTDEALEMVPTLDPTKLGGAYIYYDALTDDARLTLGLARTAAAEGAVVANYAEVTGFQRGANERIRGVKVRADDEQFTIATKAVVNATGVWSDDLLGFASGEESDTMRPAKGVHLTVPLDLVRNTVAVSGIATKDKRSMFVVPWGEHAYLGTTDTDFDGSLDTPTCTAEDVDYLLGGFNRWFTVELNPDHVVGTWAGLRPLVKQASSARTADLSRRHSVVASRYGMVSVTGGKLTTYRAMAADGIDETVEMLGLRPRRSKTSKHRLVGSPDKAPESPSHLQSRFGTEASTVEGLIADDPTLGEALVDGLSFVKAEAVHAVRAEMAQNLDDVLVRRTQAKFRGAANTAAAAESVAALIGPELGWSSERTATEVAAFRSSISDESVASPLGR